MKVAIFAVRANRLLRRHATNIVFAIYESSSPQTLIMTLAFCVSLALQRTVNGWWQSRPRYSSAPSNKLGASRMISGFRNAKTMV